MKIFELSKDWELRISDEIWGFPVYKKLLDRDKTKGKATAHKEMMFVWCYADIKSDFLAITNEKDREESIRKSVNLPDKWKKDKAIDEAINFYGENTRSIIRTLYEAALTSAADVAEYLKETKKLLNERDNNGKPVHTLNSITASIKTIPVIMRDLKTAYTEVVKEETNLDGKQKGSKTFNTFEDGLDFDD